MNLRRTQALRTYQGIRTYRAEYHGFPGARSAEMVVKVSYLSPAEKEFIVQSTAGSALIIDRVFKKLLEAEKEALDTEIQRRSALTEDTTVSHWSDTKTAPRARGMRSKLNPVRKTNFFITDESG
jgi:hypothetical protein